MLVQHVLGGLRLLGYSLAGEETVVAAPELNVCFDVGKAPREIISIDHVLLSHGHMDHAAGLAYYFSQRHFVGNEPGSALVPAPLARPIQALMQTWGDIEGHVSPARIIPLEPGDEYTIRRGLIVRAFALNHGVPALGFSVIDVRHKLKPDFAAKTGPELVALKKQGVQIEYTLEVPLIAYCGDTAEGSFLQRDFVRKAKVLVLECTFFEPEHVKRARAGKHFHVRDFARLLPRLENDFVLITHVSRRTALHHARTVLSKMVDPDDLSRVRFLMAGRPVRPPPPPKFVKNDAAAE